MTVNDILVLLRVRLSNLPIIKDNDSIIALVNLGIGVLYDRFNMSIKSETITVSPNLSLYELRDSNALMLLYVFNERGVPLKQTDTVDAVYYDYKIINYKSFVLRKPFDGVLYAVYKSSNIKLKDVNDLVELPNSMIDALLSYVTYMVNSSINRDNVNEANIWYQRFDKACIELDLKGYTVPINVESLSVQSKGYR